MMAELLSVIAEVMPSAQEREVNGQPQEEVPIVVWKLSSPSRIRVCIQRIRGGLDDEAGKMLAEFKRGRK